MFLPPSGRLPEGGDEVVDGLGDDEAASADLDGLRSDRPPSCDRSRIVPRRAWRLRQGSLAEGAENRVFIRTIP